MAVDNSVSFAGNLLEDPVFRSDSEQVKFRFAVNRKRKGDDGELVDSLDGYFDVVAWGSLAKHAAMTLRKGMRVVVVGKLVQSKYTNKEGKDVYKLEIKAEDIGPSLKWLSYIPSS